MAIVGSEQTIKKISSQIESQFPGFVREEGPQFVAFLKAYFEYMEQEGNPVDVVRSARDNQDIDRTVESFVEYFRKEFMINIPSSTLADKRLLAKHIREFYRSRGSQESYRFLFRALFGQEIEFYYPGDDILRASDGRWVRETRLRVAAPFSKSPRSFEGQQIRGVTSGASAYVQDILGTTALGLEVYDVTVQGIAGTFLDGERVYNVSDPTNYATINSQVGSIINVNLIGGGAYHNIGDKVRVNGGGSTEDAIGTVTEVTNRGGVIVKLAKTGNGYTKENTKIIVTGGNGKNFEMAIDSWKSQTIGGLSINTDIIGSVKNVRLDQGSFFVRSNANTSIVNKKLIGTVTVSSTSNTVTGINTKFQTQLHVGDLVRVWGVANTLRVHLINSNTSFVAAHTPFQNRSGANAYIGLAGANVSTVLSKALAFSSSELYAINTIALINPGYGYTTSLPTIRIVDSFISSLGLSDGYGNIYGNNAVVIANNAPGTIKKISIETPGSNFGRYDEVTISNITQGNTTIYDTTTSSNTSGIGVTTYVKHAKTFFGSALPIPSGVIQFPGRYIDTKGFLSWNNRLQDNVYYQEFSYVVRVSELLNKYKEIVKALLHPAGTKLFGDYLITGVVENTILQVDEAPVIARRSIRERITSRDIVNSFVYYANSNFAESVSATATQAASFIANTFAIESVTSTATHNATFIANTFATESVTSTATQSVTYTANTFRTETATLSASHSATFIANTFASESIAAAETHSATFIANTFATESVTSTSTENATYVANTFATESVTSTHTQNATYVANTFAIETVTSTHDQNATFTANTFRTEAATATDSVSGLKFALLPNIYVKVLNANSTISSISGYSIGTYSPVPVGVFDGSPRLVRTGTGSSFFANGLFTANTGSISVGGTGSNLYVITVPSTPTPSDSIYQVNAIFSNTVFTLRTNYTPTSANARIWFGA